MTPVNYKRNKKTKELFWSDYMIVSVFRATENI